MSDLELSTAAKSLLRAAKADGPSALARTKIWQGVATSAHVAGAGGIAAVASGTKLLAMGALFGSAVTIGLALTMLYVRPATTSPAPTSAVVGAAAPASETARRQESIADTPEPPALLPAAERPDGARAGSRDPARDASRAKVAARNEAALPVKSKLPPQPEVPPAPAPEAAPASALEPLSANANRSAPPSSNGNSARQARMDARSPGSSSGNSSGYSSGNGHLPAPAPQVVEDALMREASLIAEARGALARGDAASAMRAIRAAQGLPARQLVPESLSLEAQALRALGRGKEAIGASDKLKSEFPEHALAR